MADLKPIWTNPPVPTQDLGGDLITSRGMDPNISVDGSSGLQPVWGEPPVSTLSSGMETSNPLSGLPLEPVRWEPNDTPPPPPDLTDRNPGTIDQK